MIGDCEPKPLIPSCTTVASSTATSLALSPQAPLMVWMSMPWSGDHQLGGATRDLGVIGKTHPVASAGDSTFSREELGLELRPAVSTRPTLPLRAPSGTVASIRCAVC